MSDRDGWFWQDNPNAADGCSSACIGTACIHLESGSSSHPCAIRGQYRYQRYSEQPQDMLHEDNYVHACMSATSVWLWCTLLSICSTDMAEFALRRSTTRV